jgi:hypothetical protein
MDLLAGAIFTGILGILCGFLGARVPLRFHPVVFFPFLALLIVYHFLWRDRLFWAMLVPVSGALAWTNILPLGTGFLVGLLYQRLSGPRSHRLVQSVLIALVGTFAAYVPLLTPMPELLQPAENNGVVLQTSNATCGAASSVNLLRHYGVHTNEQDIARRARTGPGGTPLLGLYRGLCQLAPSGYSVKVLSFASPDQLQKAVAEGPVLVSLGQEWWQGEHIEFQPGKFWQADTKHAVVVTRFLAHDRVEIMDPAIGRDIWYAEGLLALWHGEGMYLQKQN